jgi:hypothetical protein
VVQQSPWASGLARTVNGKPGRSPILANGMSTLGNSLSLSRNLSRRAASSKGGRLLRCWNTTSNLPLGLQIWTLNAVRGRHSGGEQWPARRIRGAPVMLGCREPNERERNHSSTSARRAP